MLGGHFSHPVATWVLLAAGLASCVPERSQRASTTGDEPPSAAANAIDLTADAIWPAPYASDPAWLRASTGDDIDHARLAQRESALGLVEALAQGGSLGRAALRALPYAPDRYDARGALCELIPARNPESSSMLLEVLHQVIVDGPSTEESIDAQADARCARALMELTSASALSASDRDRAAGAVTRLDAR